MNNAGGAMSIIRRASNLEEEDSMSEEDMMDSEDEDETIARIQRAHFAETAAMNSRRRPAARPRRMSQKRKIEAVRNFHDFTKKLKKDTGIKIRSLGGNNLLDFSDYSSEDNKTDSDGLSEEEFTVDPSAVQDLNEENDSYIDPETGDFVESKIKQIDAKCSDNSESSPSNIIEVPKTLSISDIIDESGLDLSKNVEITEVDETDLCPEKTPEDLLDMKEDSSSQNFDIQEKLKDMGEISVKPINKTESEDDNSNTAENDEEKKLNSSALNVRRNIREVMDEKNLDASTLTAQRQESERLARVQEQQRIIREVQRQIAINRQNKIHQKTLSLLQGGSSILKKSTSGQKLNLPNTVLVKLPSGEIKKTSVKPGQLEVTKVPKPTTSASALAQRLSKPDQKGEKKEVVEIVDSSSGEESSSSSSDSDDCIMLSDSEVPPSPEAEDDPGNSGLHVNDAYNIPDEQGRVQINIGHPENEEDIFLAPQIARVIKPHQIGGVRFLFDNIIESTERFSTSTGFGCILAHSMGLGKTLQIVCFCDIFLRHTSSKTVLCIMPINTLQNWVAEFNMWLPVDAANSPLAAHGEVRTRNFPIYVLNDSHKTLQMRAKVVKDWTTTGGVLMIGYELYRLLSMKKDKKPRKKKKADAKLEAEKEKEDKKNDVGNDDTTQGSDAATVTKASDDTRIDGQEGDVALRLDDNKEDKKDDTPSDEDKKLLDEMYEALVKPGPDLVICDEGHRIKNSHSNISYALKQMRTKRRVVLTGYPLQNNLLEYWCMVDFVRPNYLGSKTEFCNMFERPIQNGQCIDSTPQDIRLMRYRAHVLHSLLVGFVQRRSHAVLQSTLPQKEEYVLLVRMTPLQRKLYDRFMNEVVRSASVPNPLKAFAICCKIWNHPDVLYNFLKKRSEVSAAIEEDLDLEEIGGVTKAGRAKNGKAQPRRPGKPRGSSKKPAATIPPNTTAPVPPRQDTNTQNTQYSNTAYGSNPARADRPPGNYPPYPPYQNTPPGYYPPGQNYNQEYGNNYYPQQPPYDNNYPNQYPPSNPEQNYSQNYWSNNSYYGNPGYYNNPQYTEGQPPPPNFNPNQAPGFENSQPYQGNYNTPSNASTYTSGAPPNNQQYPANSAPANNTPYAGRDTPSGTSYNQNNVTPTNSSFSATAVPPNNAPYANNSVPTNNSNYPVNNETPSNQYPSTNVPPNTSYPGNNAPYPPNSENYNNLPRSQPYQGPYNNPASYSQYDPSNGPPQPYQNNQTPANYPGYQSQQYPGNNPYPANPSTPYNQYENSTEYANNYPPNMARQENIPSSQHPVKTELNIDPPYSQSVVKQEPNVTQNASAPYGASYNYNQQSHPDYNNQFPNYSQPMETKPPLCSASSGSPVTSWPMPTDTIKTELDRLKMEDKMEIKSESDGEVKIEDLDTKTIVKDEIKKDKFPTPPTKSEPVIKAMLDTVKDNGSDSEPEVPKRGKGKGKGKEKSKAEKSPRPTKAKAKPKSRKDRKTSKEKTNEESESEHSEKEEKLNKEEELALVKKAEEMTYDWATDLLRDYIPGLIENSAKMELFFYILNESIKLGDRLLLFSQSLFTLNLIEDFLERNYIPGTNRLWERNTSYFRLDGSTHALEREKLINEFNANPNVYLFLVSTRAGSLGINLVGANRVIVFDASWNPCHDTQAVCRVYRYGQRKPCFVYRFVMDCCLEKKIYDRQINKQGMADRVVDECNPDAVLSMKEITNLCFDNDEKESEPKDLLEYKDKYIDVLMQGILTLHSKLLTKEPFQHESLLVDRKEKKLSSAEKRLAQRGYELEKKAASAPKPTTAYRTVRTADGSLVQRPVASVRPMQHGARWIPADVWRRQGMTAQEMTLPLDVVIPTNSSEKTNIVLKAGQRVMVLKSPKGIYMQLESGKIIAIKTALKGLGQKGDSKDSTLGKKVMGSRPSSAHIPGSLKNNSAITITSKSGPRFQRVQTRPSMMGPKMGRSMLPGQKIAEIRNRLGEMRSYGARPKLPTPNMRMLRPSLPGSLSITKVPKKPDERHRAFEEETQVLDSDDEDLREKTNGSPSSDRIVNDKDDKNENKDTSDSSSKDATSFQDKESKVNTPIVLTTDEKLPSEEALETRSDRNGPEVAALSQSNVKDEGPMNLANRGERKINLLKNYRHQRPISRPQPESSLSQLEKTATTLNKEGVPDFRKNLDDITQSYSPSVEEKTSGRKKRSPQKIETQERPNMSHSVSSMLGTTQKQDSSNQIAHGVQEAYNLSKSQAMPLNMTHSGLMTGGTTTSKEPIDPPPPMLPNDPVFASGSTPPEGYGQYPGYGMGYGAYPHNPAYYGGYSGGYYPPYAPPQAPFPPPPNNAPDPYLPPNPQW